VITSPPLVKQLGRAARQIAEQHLDIRRATQKLVAHYDEVASLNAGRTS
jgi:hypothetical protein